MCVIPDRNMFLFFLTRIKLFLLFQIRRRRPTPATLVASSDQSSPGKALKCKRTHTYKLSREVIVLIYIHYLQAHSINFIHNPVLLKLASYICILVTIIFDTCTYQVNCGDLRTQWHGWKEDQTGLKEIFGLAGIQTNNSNTEQWVIDSWVIML